MLLVQAQLTDNSWLLHKSVRLTGGFAFASWWGPNSGQFVVTVGGYHPRFHHDGYPVVPRVGLSWKPIYNISVVGETYFALCSEAMMAGAELEAAAQFGPAHARLRFGGDGIVFFDPFWFSVGSTPRRGRHQDLAAVRERRHRRLARRRRRGHRPADLRQGPLQRLRLRVPFEFGDEGDPADARSTRASSPTSTCAAAPTRR